MEYCRQWRLQGSGFRFLGAFDKLWKEINTYVKSVSPYVRLLALDNFLPIRQIFVELDIWIFFENMSKKNSCLIKI